MGPIVLFDKSFLQSLSLDEAVLFDHFFTANITPLFFVETLADLEKAVRHGRTPEQEVGIIAEKTPEMHSGVNVYHGELCLNNLFGGPVRMTGSIYAARGKPVRVKDKIGVVFKESLEQQAFSRWQDRDFLQVERQYAKVWREALRILKFDKIINKLNELGIDPKTCKNLDQAKMLADRFVSLQPNYKYLQFAMGLLGIAINHWEKVIERWKETGKPNLPVFAPYVAYTLTVNVFFYICLAAKLFSGQKISNRVDLAYLYYLPFCMVFVSSDKFHRRTAPLFQRLDQEFVWGEELKAALGEVHRYYEGLPQSEKEKGLVGSTRFLDAAEDSCIGRLWDRFCPSWRTPRSSPIANLKPEANERVISMIKSFKDAPPAGPITQLDGDDLDAVLISRNVRRKRGSYWQVAKHLKD